MTFLIGFIYLQMKLTEHSDAIGWTGEDIEEARRRGVKATVIFPDPS